MIKLDLFESESISLNCMPGLLVNSLNKYCAGLKNITLKEEAIPTHQISKDRFWHASKTEKSIWATYFADRKGWSLSTNLTRETRNP